MRYFARAVVVGIVAGAVALPAIAQERTKADANGDQQITFDELRAVRPTITQEEFNRRDKNGDGVLTEADRRAVEKPKNEVMEDTAAAKPKGDRDRYLTRADADKDGRITMEEIRAVMPKFPEDRFNTLDANSDGALDRTELRRAAADGPGLLFGKADTDKNGLVTFDEVTALDSRFPQARFDAMDGNGDGALSREEMRGAIDQRMQMVAKADADGDGSITLDELKAEAPNITAEQFKRMDMDGDGVLTKNDREVARQRRADDAAPMSGGNDEMRYNMLRQLASSDENEDKRITFEEVTAKKPGFPRSVYDRYDVDKDGVITDADR